MLVSLRNFTLFARSFGPRTGLVARILAAQAAHRERQALLALDAFLLDDIGLTREQAMTEAQRPIWDAPSTWRR